MLACLTLLGSLIMTCAIELANPSLDMVPSSPANFSSLELSVLQDLYNVTGGEDWRWKSDSFGIPWNFSSNANPCAEDWQGIQCTLPPPFDTYHVANLSLSDYGLYGPILASLGQLYYLEGLDLYHNHLTGTVPFSSFNRTSLAVLNLTTNYITGTIPENLGTSLPRLTVLGISENSLHGTLPASLNMTIMEVLSLNKNHINGSIPVLPKLSYLDLSWNFEIDGAIPVNLGYMMPKLTYLDLSYNSLVSTIPVSILNMSCLETMILHDNMISGTIPEMTGFIMPRLVYFSVFYNLLAGPLPQSFGLMFPRLETFKGQYNMMDGRIPSSIESLAHLKVLDLAHNAFTGPLQHVFNSSTQYQLKTVILNNNVFTGTLPESLLRNSNLETLAIDNNCFHGTISDSICKNTNLEILTLGCLRGSCVDHPFTSVGSRSFIVKDPVNGSVPSCIFELPKLRQLALLGNGLTGSIPQNIRLSTNLTVLFLSNNYFSGPIPLPIQKVMNFDLSYNSFDGHYSGCDTCEHGQTVDVRYNYLSGSIPSNVQAVRGINLLSGNILACNEDRSDLPRTDSARSYYQCGSDDFNKPMYTWSAIFILTFVSIAAVYHCRNSVKYLNIKDAFVYGRLWVIGVRNTKLPFLCEVRYVGNYITLVGLSCASILVVIGAPMYGLLTVYCGTYTSQYAWTLSLVLLTGVVPFAMGIALLFLALLVFTVIYARNSSTSPAGDVFLTSHSERPRYTFQVVLVCGAYFLVNLVIPVAANVYYLGIVVWAPATLQVTMSVYKFMWNSIVTPYLSRWLVYELSKHRADFFTLELFVALLSNVIAPLFSLLVVSPQCFYGIFGSQNSAFEFLYYSESVYNVVYYYFPFRYQYQCTFAYMEYYASAFVYLSIFSAFGIPVYEMTLLFLYTRAVPDTYWYFLLRRYLPRILRPLETNPEKIPPRDIFRPYFDATKFFISQLTCLALILSLGVVSPPLAACLAVTMLATSAYTVLKVGRFLTNATEANQPKYIELIDEESRGVVTLQALSRAFWLLLSFSCAFMAPFLFDVLGSTEGFQSSYWVLIVVPLCPLVAYIMVRIWRFVHIKYGPKAFDVNDVNSSEYSNNGTGKAGENDNALEMSSVVMSPLVDETCKL